MTIAELPALAQRIGYTVSASASVWGDSGPTVIRVEEGPTAVYVAMRHGTTASVRHTATGKVFAAFGPRERAAAALAAEGFAGALDEPAFAAELEAVRKHKPQSFLLKNYISEPFFETKQIIHLPMVKA